MKTIRNLVYVLAVMFATSFLDGTFTWGLPNSFYVFSGVVQVICIVWLLVLVHKK